MRDDTDDEELLAPLGDDDALMDALREAIRAREAVPAWFVETGKSAYAWHNIDAELAQLTYDSERDQRMAAATRSETASIRALTFTSAAVVYRIRGLRGLPAGPSHSAPGRNARDSYHYGHQHDDCR